VAGIVVELAEATDEQKDATSDLAPVPSVSFSSLGQKFCVQFQTMSHTRGVFSHLLRASSCVLLPGKFAQVFTQDGWLK